MLADYVCTVLSYMCCAEIWGATHCTADWGAVQHYEVLHSMQYEVLFSSIWSVALQYEMMQQYEVLFSSMNCCTGLGMRCCTAVWDAVQLYDVYTAVWYTIQHAVWCAVQQIEMLCSRMRCCTAVWCAIKHAVWCAVQQYEMLYSSMMCCTAVWCAVQHNDVLYSRMRCCTAVWCAVQQ